MPKYSAGFTNVANTDNADIIYTATPVTPTRRCKLYEFVIGSRSTPADASCSWEILKVTDENATPGGTAVTPVPIDNSDGASLFNAVQSPTGAPTVGAIMLNLPVHQRATYRWLASPGYEFVTQLVEDHGFLLRSDGPTAAFNVWGSLFVEE